MANWRAAVEALTTAGEALYPKGAQIAAEAAERLQSAATDLMQGLRWRLSGAGAAPAETAAEQLIAAGSRPTANGGEPAWKAAGGRL